MVDVVFNRPPAPRSRSRSQDPPPDALERAVGSTRSGSGSPRDPARRHADGQGGHHHDRGDGDPRHAADPADVHPSSQSAADHDDVGDAHGVESTEGASLPHQTLDLPRPPASSPAARRRSSVTPCPQVASDERQRTGRARARRSRRRRTARSTAIRFYKGAGNGGTHVGSLWNTTGNRLAQVTFTGETPTGWQRADAVHTGAGHRRQTYVVSYLAPQGHYSSTSAFFNTPLTQRTPDGAREQQRALPLRRGRRFPTNSWAPTNYFVDVEYVPARAHDHGDREDAGRRRHGRGRRRSSRRSHVQQPDPGRLQRSRLQVGRHRRARHGRAVRRRQEADLHTVGSSAGGRGRAP